MMLNFNQILMNALPGMEIVPKYAPTLLGVTHVLVTLAISLTRIIKVVMVHLSLCMEFFF